MKLRYVLSPCLVLFLVASCPAQTVEYVREFLSQTGVQFLPGGYVVGDDEPDVGPYVFQGSKFVRFKGELPALAKDWNAYDGDADYQNQTNKKEYLPDNSADLLPRWARVKKFFIFDIPGTTSSLLLICYTRELRIEGSNTQDIYLTTALNTNPRDLRSRYRKLRTRKLQSTTNYGDLQHQVVPGAGNFLLLYTVDVGGDALNFTLDVYRIRGLEEPKTEDKASQRKPGHRQ